MKRIALFMEMCILSFCSILHGQTLNRLVDITGSLRVDKNKSLYYHVNDHSYHHRN